MDIMQYCKVDKLSLNLSHILNELYEGQKHFIKNKK